MRIPLYLVSLFAAQTLASVTASTEDVAASTISQDSALSTSVTATETSKTALATSSVSSSDASTTSIASVSTTSSSGSSFPTGPNVYNGGQAGAGNQVDTDAGASGGSGGSMSLSKGGLIAIIVVVAVVAVFGITTTVLWVIAKRRQWSVRASIARSARKVADGLRTPRTGRFLPPPSASNTHEVRINGRRVDKRGTIYGVSEVKDVERGYGRLAGKAPENTRGSGSGWAQRLWGNNWK